MRLALLLWSGSRGGAQAHTASLAVAMRRLGADARVLFVTSPGPLAAELDDLGVPWAALGHRRGRHVLLHPRGLARRAAELGPDGAVTPSPGYLPGGAPDRAATEAGSSRSTTDGSSSSTRSPSSGACSGGPTGRVGSGPQTSRSPSRERSRRGSTASGSGHGAW